MGLPAPGVEVGNGEFGRFGEPGLVILVSLGGGPNHGYAIGTDIEGTIGRPLGPGTQHAAWDDWMSEGSSGRWPMSTGANPMS